MHVTALWASGMRGAGRLLGGGSVAIERAADWPGVVQAPGGRACVRGHRSHREQGIIWASCLMDQREEVLAHFGNWECLPELGGLRRVLMEERVGEVRLSLRG